MFECGDLIHPFQNDPGTSQRQRVMEDLLSGSAKIDGRTMADLLDYFVQLSRHVNYYNTDLSIGDWQPFFQKSIPFSLAAIIKYNRNTVSDKVIKYSKSFDRRPSKAGLQLLIHYLFQEVISRINEWHVQLKGSGLPAELIIEKMIKDKLRGPLEKFICYNNTAVRRYCMKSVNFLPLSRNDVWGLTTAKLNPKTDDVCKPKEKTRRKRLIELRDNVKDLFPSFLDPIRIIAGTAGQSMEQSFFPLKEELQKLHSPHLAVVFAFLKLFVHLQDDLNKYTKKHLDFFYKEVLQLKTKPAQPDKVHLVFEIQKQLNKYLLKKGLAAKDGKDVNKQEILYALDDEIVVNKTQAVDKRTLFLNNQNFKEHTYVEGVYIAPDATKADGIEKDFKDDGPKSFPTLGAKQSKYTDPEKVFPQNYPNARLGFILASPVLLLNEGKRTINITLACQLSHNYCGELVDTLTPVSRNCCEENQPGNSGNPSTIGNRYPHFFHGHEFYTEVAAALNETYYYINEDLIVEAAKKGISKELEKNLRDVFLKQTSKLCYCESETYNYDALVTNSTWTGFRSGQSTAEQLILDELFKPRKALKVLFSGEKEWIEPKFDSIPPPVITISPALIGGNTFLLKITSVIEADQPAITFFDKEKLKEDFNTTLPLVKIELDDKVKLLVENDELDKKVDNQNLEENVNEDVDDCCLLREPSVGKHAVSLYHFFRNVFVIDQVNNEKTRIDVSVCGLKNFIVQNEESVQDVNSPVYPFGTRPDVVDFSVVNPIFCITAAFIADLPGTMSASAITFLNSLLTPANQFKKSISRNELETFLNTKDSSNNPIFNNSDKIAIRAEVNDPTKKFCLFNQTGPGFFIGSKEIFCKKWINARVNLNWKDKPADFREYYSAYVVEDVAQQIYGLNQDNFKIRVSALKDGSWSSEANVRKLFDVVPPPAIPPLPPLVTGPCAPDGTYSQGILLRAADFPALVNQSFTLDNSKDAPLTVNTRNGFIRITLQDQDFLHKDYGFVLARQMMAMGKYPDILEGAVYRKEGNTIIVFRSLGKTLIELKQEIFDTKDGAQLSSDKADSLNTTFDTAIDFPPPLTSISDPDRNTLIPLVHDNKSLANDTLSLAQSTKTKSEELNSIIDIFNPNSFEVVKPLSVIIPNEPWTPIIKNLSIDYTASATIRDIALIHLYPYKDTYKSEELELKPSLLPVFCDEGTLFIGLKDLVPPSTLNILFQLAEATSDSESDREDVNWHYLDNNQWKKLREGFEVLDDATDGLTTSGIVKFAFPENMTKDNTILPKDLHWIKVSIPKSSKAVSETIGIHTQAIRAIFTNTEANDKLRLNKPLTAGEVSKLNEADANVKKLVQPYDSFGGLIPEGEGHFYLRVSELLRHKGRAIQKFDYERLALEAFPQLFKAKCINHSFALNAHEYFNDFPIAPGYVILAVIPDLNQLKATESFEPRVPVSMLDDLQEYFKKRTSPFVRFRAMNPRYEKIQFCLKVKLYIGKDETYYKEKLKQDLRELLAPWAVGQYDKLTFGQCVSRSEIIRFLESRDYIDCILDLRMKHEFPGSPEVIDKVCPKTPRSILIAGDIDICIASNDCEEWQLCRDQQGRPVDCCKNPKVPIADYCPDIIVG
jgi:hypothetical protein